MSTYMYVQDRQDKVFLSINEGHEGRHMVKGLPALTAPPTDPIL